ncbi:MAG: single-stranded-DNA-specific exonuclease RecJ [Terriglobales bacterium]
MPFPVRAVDAAVAARLEQQVGVTPFAARWLAARGWSDAQLVRDFLSPSLASLHAPWRMKGMEIAVERILGAIAARETILIYGDYDADGTTAVVILRKALTMLGAHLVCHIPQRLVEGYGMHREPIERAAAEGVRLVISVDTGVRAFAVVERAAALGMDIIITDHHLPEERAVAALAVLNPHQSDCDYPDKNLSGVGVAFKLVQALFERTGRAAAGAVPAWLAAFLKIVALGTIADAVPLTGENRIFAYFGLEGLRQPANPGLQALIQTALPDKSAAAAFTAEDVSFRLAPRLNAAGRMGGAELVLELFAAPTGEAGELAQQLERLNRERRRVEDQIRAELASRFATDLSLADDRVLVLDGDGWHRGVLGIVAARILERTGKPTLIFAREGGTAYGSGRAPAGLHLLALLESCPDLFIRFGGHAAAVGCALPCEHLQELRRRLNEVCSRLLPPASVAVTAPADMALRFGEIHAELLAECLRFAPFGMGNPAPRFAAHGVRLVVPLRILKDKHLKLTVEQDGRRFDALAWNAIGDGERSAAALLREFQPGTALDLLFCLEQTQHPQYGDRIQLILQALPLRSEDRQTWTVGGGE